MNEKRDVGRVTAREAENESVTARQKIGENAILKAELDF